MSLAARAKRAGDHEEAVGLWAAAAEAGDPLALHELALHHEHRGHDPETALLAVDRALDILDGREDPRSQRLSRDFWHRRRRLVGKLKRRASPD